MVHAGVPDSVFALAVSWAMYSGGPQSEEAKDPGVLHSQIPQTPALTPELQLQFPQKTPTYASIPHLTNQLPNQFFDSDDDAWKLGGTPQPRPRPSYQGMHITESAQVFMAKLTQSTQMTDSDENDVLVKEALDELTAANGHGSVDYGSILNACYMLADAPAKDMKWSQALRSNDRYSLIPLYFVQGGD